MKFELKAAQNTLIQSSQNADISFSVPKLLDDDTVTNQVDFFKCRDYFSDILYSPYTDTYSSISGFKWDPKHHKFDPESGMILVKVPTNNADNFSKNVSELLNTMEKFWKVGTTDLVRLESKEQLYTYFLVDYDPKFNKATYLLSFYTILLRICTYKRKEGLEGLVPETPEAIRNFFSLAYNDSEIFKCIIDKKYKLITNPFKALELPDMTFKSVPKSHKEYNDLTYHFLHDYMGVKGFYRHLQGTYEKGSDKSFKELAKFLQAA